MITVLQFSDHQLAKSALDIFHDINYDGENLGVMWADNSETRICRVLVTQLTPETFTKVNVNTTEHCPLNISLILMPVIFTKIDLKITVILQSHFEKFVKRKVRDDPISFSDLHDGNQVTLEVMKNSVQGKLSNY